MKLLGLDIGSNSVGSVWVDTDKKLIQMGDSVFPAGIEESDTKRSTEESGKAREAKPKKKHRKTTKRKHQIRTFLLKRGWMPRGESKKRSGLRRVIHGYFGRKVYIKSLHNMNLDG